VRSLPDLRACGLVLLLLAATPSLAATKPVTAAEVDQAIEVVKNDPNLASKETVRSLRWHDTDKKKKPRPSSSWPSWLGWIGDLFSWIGQASRMLMWVVIGVLAALLVYFIIKIFAGQRITSSARRFVPPTHVQDLDIRPESLPEDIGATARALWDRGEHRAALALLYRGLLSRLAHVYEVPIRDSSTEGDCLRLAARTLEAGTLDYATRLVRTWQRAIYGGLTIEDPVVHELCAQFDLKLARQPATEAMPREGFASGAAT
jgi:uncharacterized protein DUF4129